MMDGKVQEVIGKDDPRVEDVNGDEDGKRVTNGILSNDRLRQDIRELIVVLTELE